MIQDIEPKHLYNEWKKNAVPKKSSAVVQFRGQDLLCRIDDNGLKFPSRAQFTEPDEAFTYLFELDGREYYLLFDENERALDGYSYRNIGLFRTEKPKELAYAAVSAWHLCSWYRDARYCGRCGEKLVHDGNERMMRCPKCGNMIFPRINPSVIVAVTHGDYLLLTKYANRPGAQRTALVAGFTEFAESFEQTVHREVMEEVGLKVKDLRYYRCQPWGISGNIMMGYWCRLDGDDDTIHLDNFELADGAWVSRKELQETFVNNGIALTAEMISEFAAGTGPVQLGEKQVKKEKRLSLSRQPLFSYETDRQQAHVVPLRELAELSAVVLVQRARIPPVDVELDKGKVALAVHDDDLKIEDRMVDLVCGGVHHGDHRFVGFNDIADGIIERGGDKCVDPVRAERGGVKVRVVGGVKDAGVGREGVAGAAFAVCIDRFIDVGGVLLAR